MRTKATTGWPEVQPNDHGIRPAGKPDECFYCRAKVGSPHGQKCVTVSKIVLYDVLVDGNKAGEFQRDDPHFWTEKDCEFHKNESSWCKDNAAEAIVWSDAAAKAKVEGALAADPNRCLCSLISFRFNRVVDTGPLVDVEEPGDAKS